MLTKAYAKINISLDITGKRDDGYHLLKMIMQTINLHDTLNIEEDTTGINIECSNKRIPTDKRNLVYKAAESFMKYTGLKRGVHIYIQKKVPSAAGLGGGSSDAASTLKALNKIFNAGLSDSELMKLGLSIGADVPFFIKGGTAICEGIGEKIKNIRSFKNHYIVIVKPWFGVSTSAAYREFDSIQNITHPDTMKIIEHIENDDLTMVSKNMRNVLEDVSVKAHPEIGKIKEELKNFGALNSLMSGSGSAVFGIFESEKKARMCLGKINRKNKIVLLSKTI